jgi:hypothetical protein
MKKIYSIILIVIFLGVTAWLIWSYLTYAKTKTATSAETELNLEVTPGFLSEAVVAGLDGSTDVEMEKVYLSGSDIETKGKLVTSVRDHRGSNAGWTQTMSCTDFTSGANKILANNLTVKPQTINPLGESDLSGVYLGTQHTMVDENDVAILMYAANGYGRGRYQAESELILLVERLTLPGRYTAEITLTIS